MRPNPGVLISSRSLSVRSMNSTNCLESFVSLTRLLCVVGFMNDFPFCAKLGYINESAKSSLHCLTLYPAASHETSIVIPCNRYICICRLQGITILVLMKDRWKEIQMEPRHPFFRAKAIQEYLQRPEEDILPRFFFPYITTLSSLLLSLLVLVGLLVWRGEVPFFIPGSGVVLTQDPEHILRNNEMGIVLFLPEKYISQL